MPADVVDRLIHKRLQIGLDSAVPAAPARGSADDAAAEADRDGMRTGARLKLREKVADVRLHRLLGEEEPLADLAVDEAVGDQLEHLDLAHRRLLLELAQRALERDHLGARPGSAARRDLLEPARVICVPAQDLFALGGVHARDIGLPVGPL
jgi:hypothetical protein